MLDLVTKLKDVPGVVAVALGGSRATGKARADSDWDFVLYYSGSIDTHHIRGLGFEGHVVEPGEWGRLVNGGAWLRVDGERVDLLYRDVDVVGHWTDEAEAGRFEIDRVPGHIAGLPTYVLAAELALGRVLHGELPRPMFPALLRETARNRWLNDATFALVNAEGAAAAADVARCRGLLAQALICVAHSRLASDGVWVVNEKRISEKAGLRDAALDLLGSGANLPGIVAEAWSSLGLHPPTTLRLDEPSEASP